MRRSVSPTERSIVSQPVNPNGAAPAAPALAIRGLVKVYGNLIAVADLSLDIPVGSFYGIVGPNGAGKTTTLTMATGLLRPDRGTAFVYGVDVWGDTAKARSLLGLIHVGMLHGVDRATASDRSNQLLQALDLTEAGKKLIADYSAGMTKKIALAAAMIHSPKLLVLDEPFEAVDPVSAANIRQILMDYTKRGGTVILSSHVMATVQQLCTHVAVINHGRVLAAGTTAEVAQGGDLDARFAQLVGGVHNEEGLTWLGN